MHFLMKGKTEHKLPSKDDHELDIVNRFSIHFLDYVFPLPPRKKVKGWLMEKNASVCNNNHNVYV